MDAALNHSATCDVALVRSEQVGRPQHGSVGTAILRLVQVQLWLRAVRPHTADGGTTQYSCADGVKTDATLSCTPDVCSTAQSELGTAILWLVQVQDLTHNR